MIVEVGDEYLDWYNSRPEIIKKALNIVPPDKFYKLKSTGVQCYIYSIDEPVTGLFEDVTITVNKTGVGSKPHHPEWFNKAQVFGIKIEDLEPWID